MTDMASACLIGTDCRYDGGSKPDTELARRFQAGEIIPFCPETAAGLGVPRSRMHIDAPGDDILGGKGSVRNERGEDKTAEMILGAKKIAAFAVMVKPDIIFLKSKSPSCGIKTDGIKGVTAALLEREGFRLEEMG
jgi:uncharacterized protein YbbK (DUF523 family)